MSFVESVDISYEKVCVDGGLDVNQPINRIERIVKIHLNGDEIGYFIINGTAFKPQCESFGTGRTNDMSIQINDGYKGKGYSRLMVQRMVKGIQSDCPKLDRQQMLFIDMDMSEGFWDHIGMKEGRYGLDAKRQSNRARKLEGYGYEKYFTFHDLQNYALGIPISSKSIPSSSASKGVLVTLGGRKKKQRTQKRSHRKSRRRT
jgi:hypothetical protein